MPDETPTPEDEAMIERVFDDPWGIVAEALLVESRGEPMSELLAMAVDAAATYLTCAMLTSAGVDLAQAMRLFEDGKYVVRLHWQRGESPDEDQLSLTVIWDDPEQAPIRVVGSPEVVGG